MAQSCPLPWVSVVPYGSVGILSVVWVRILISDRAVLQVIIVMLSQHGTEQLWKCFRGEKLLGQYVRSMCSGNSPWCMPFPAQALPRRLNDCHRPKLYQEPLWLEVPAQAHHKLPFLAFQVLPSSSCAPWSEFSLFCPTFSDFFFIHCLFKTFYSQRPPQKWYTYFTSTYLSFPRTGIFNNETTNTDTWTPLGFKIIIVQKIKRLHFETVANL